MPKSKNGYSISSYCLQLRVEMMEGNLPFSKNCFGGRTLDHYKSSELIGEKPSETNHFVAKAQKLLKASIQDLSDEDSDFFINQKLLKSMSESISSTLRLFGELTIDQMVDKIKIRSFTSNSKKCLYEVCLTTHTEPDLKEPKIDEIIAIKHENSLKRSYMIFPKRYKESKPGYKRQRP
ncbi:hypothetical protein RF11_08102 [Thelohanellus kitauei]|uniref:Uncharacterized protein n=1 Tax=Thelohanellus kitauei TaxID=669202 RepID=A0A0C2MAD9_THEKT|nr:hypothetical protein RF11_08102 [Thelohanellus kitauei]